MTAMSLPGLAPVVGVLVLAELAAGTLLAIYAGDLLGDAGRGFLGTTAVICLALMGVCLGLAALLPDPARLLHVPVDGTAFAGFVHWAVGFTAALAVYALLCAVGTDPARRVAGGVALLCGAVAIGHAAATFGASHLGGVAGLVAFAPAALLSGSTLAGMLLGHWYLIVPDLSFRPLRRAALLIFIALGVQAVAVAVALATAGGAIRASLLGERYGASFWLLVVGAGLIVTAAVNGLTLYYARIRANQPATAMLYVAVITVMMGVVPGHLLYFLTGAPV
jgi:hypothetical protein